MSSPGKQLLAFEEGLCSIELGGGYIMLSYADHVR
jgi:hypothetical protein